VAAVEDGDVVAAGVGLFGDSAADEAGSAEDEQFHPVDLAVLRGRPEGVLAQG
jgi:hypothetical protein